ncbi:MAG: hypothetical protein SW833_14815 [Cyanobacteriota bacterium]|nr:hypothetical protein [Cyanobacteriota bacterium]
MEEPHIEIKTRYIDSGDAKKMIQKGTIIGVITTARISKPAKQLFDQSGIAWAENVPKQDLE